VTRAYVCQVGLKTVVEHLNVVGHREPGRGPGGEGLSVVHLVLKAPKKLSAAAVPAHAGAADTGADAVGPAEPGEPRRDVWTALVLWKIPPAGPGHG
jgi:hypothetical protein